MAYQAKRRKKYEEEFQLVDEDGNIVKTIPVSLDADDMIAKINRKYVALTRILSETTNMKKEAEEKKVTEDCLEKLGKAVVEMLEAVFGENDTETIVNFYEGRYIEMCQEVVPFISSCVIPRCIEIKKENQKSILHSYNRNQRRAFFKKVR